MSIKEVIDKLIIETSDPLPIKTNDSKIQWQNEAKSSQQNHNNINAEIEKQLFELNHSVSNNGKIVLYSWVYYNKDDDLCILTNEKGKFTVKSKSKLIEIDTYFIKLVDKRICDRIYDIKDELKYIKNSQDLYNKSNEIIKYISSEINDFNYGLTTFEAIWLIKNNNKNYLKITIDLYKFIIKLTNYQDEFDTEIIITSKNLKTFLNLNKSKILQVIKNNNKLHKVRMEKNKRNDYEKHLQEIKQNQLNAITPHDATRKVGSRVKEPQIYIKKSLKERYEIQAQKPFPTKYPWDTELNSQL